MEELGGSDWERKDIECKTSWAMRVVDKDFVVLVEEAALEQTNLCGQWGAST